MPGRDDIELEWGTSSCDTAEDGGGGDCARDDMVGLGHFARRLPPGGAVAG